MFLDFYLDHAAATPLFPEVKLALEAYFGKNLGNPSSVHRWGRESRNLIDTARFSAAKYFGSEMSEVFFTSGATESLHLAIIGTAIAKIKSKKIWYNKNSQAQITGEKLIIYVSPLVHVSVWNVLRFLEENFLVQTKFLPLNSAGFLDISEIGESILTEADLIISEHGNSETGHLQPVSKLGKKIEKFRSELPISCSDEKFKEILVKSPIFIVDVAASIVSENVGLCYQKADIIALSGEKFGAMPGSGILIKKTGVPMTPIIGGTQEFGVRGGTENVFGILGITAALDVLSEKKSIFRENYLLCQHQCRLFFEKNLPECAITTPTEKFLSHIFHFRIPNGAANLLVVQSDLSGVFISAGSACSSGSVGGSNVLKNLGFSDTESEQGIRISFGWNTKLENLQKALTILALLIKKL